jgi:hypothetical protein
MAAPAAAPAYPPRCVGKGKNVPYNDQGDTMKVFTAEQCAALNGRYFPGKDGWGECTRGAEGGSWSWDCRFSPDATNTGVANPNFQLVALLGAAALVGVIVYTQTQ